MSNKKSNDFSSLFDELDRRVRRLTNLFDSKLVTLSRHFCAILLSCDNSVNRHFAENALVLFTFVAFEIEALRFGHLKFEGQERFYKGFISKQCGSFDNSRSGGKGDPSGRLTSCCVANLSNEVESHFLLDKLN
jgi:hypothetical protein